MAQLNTECVSQLKGLMDTQTERGNGAPGLAYVAVNRDGQVLFEHASGVQGVGSRKPVSVNSVFWLASCTKIITGIAVMQLVEQGKLALDDAAQVAKIAPVHFIAPSVLVSSWIIGR